MKKIRDMVASLEGIQKVWEDIHGPIPASAKLAYYKFSLKMFRFAIRDIQITHAQQPNELRKQLRANFFNATQANRWKLGKTFLANRDFKRFFRAITI